MHELISLCITTHNRPHVTHKAYEQVLGHQAIGEIIIVDDFSKPALYSELIKGAPKEVKVFRNTKNLGVYRNKHESVKHAAHPWVIPFDSDNIITPAYIDVLLALPEWRNDTAYLPSFARPHFDYRKLAGTYTRTNISNYMRTRGMDALLNTMNFFISKKLYMDAFDPRVEPVTSDSIYINYRILQLAGRLQVVPGLEYEHVVHDGSHYKLNNMRAPHVYREILGRLKMMR